MYSRDRAASRGCAPSPPACRLASPGPGAARAAPGRLPEPSRSRVRGSPPPWSEGSAARRGPLEPGAMDAVLEPFPADRLFPGSSFLDLGDLNESDFLNNAVRTKGVSASLCTQLSPLSAGRLEPRKDPQESRRGLSSGSPGWTRA